MRSLAVSFSDSSRRFDKKHHRRRGLFRKGFPGEDVSFVDAEVIAVFPILADPVDVKRGDQQCETASQPSTQPDKVD